MSIELLASVTEVFATVGTPIPFALYLCHAAITNCEWMQQFFKIVWNEIISAIARSRNRDDIPSGSRSLDMGPAGVRYLVDLT
jgi:hypothetical protein